MTAHSSLYLARAFGLVCLAMFGALLGGLATSRWHNLALLISCVTGVRLSSMPPAPASTVSR
jgi:hypothetical protein